VRQPYSVTMANFPRHAIYYAPAPGSVLERFGSALLGYDARRGLDLPFPGGIDIPDWRELTHDPRKYGFHATLKAPMALAPGRREDELVAACAAFAAKPRNIPAIKPVVDSIEGFIAIVPATRGAALEGLAADCVREFDAFRAPLSEEDLARRNPSKLTPRQRDYLDHWGYPYVFEEFRFHMTLTGRLAAGRHAAILDMLRSRFRDCGVNDVAIDRIALFRQDAPDQRFQIVATWPLEGLRLERAEQADQMRGQMNFQTRSKI
jgi:putative phosphonate metabolism protein